MEEEVGRKDWLKRLVGKVGRKGWLKRLVEKVEGWLSRKKHFGDFFSTIFIHRTSSKDSSLLRWHHDLHSNAPTCIILRHDLANEKKASNILGRYYAGALHVARTTSLGS